MKGKIISLILVFFISFSLFSGSYQKKAEASTIVLGYAAFKAGIAFSGFAAYAGMLYANGYNMPMQELIVGFANKYYDYSNGQYIAKGDKMNVLDKLNLATSSFLTGNDFLTYSELNEIKNDVAKEYPMLTNLDNITVDHTFTAGTTDYYNYGWFKDNQGFMEFTSQYDGKTVKILHNNYPDYFAYLKLINHDWHLYGNNYYPTVQLIQPNGQTSLIKLGMYVRIRDVSTSQQTFNFRTSWGSSNYLEYAYGLFKDNFVNTGDPIINYEVAPNSFADGTGDFIKAYPNYYSALSGKAATTEDLENLMNTDEYLQREITALIENQAVNTENQLEVPLIDGGVITYPDSVVTDPDVPYVPGATWYDNILDGVTSIPDLFIGKMTDLIDDKITPALESLKNTVLTIPDLISNIWQWILDFPDLLYSWFVPTAPMIAETWEPVMDLWDLKLDPIIAPFKTLTFYETEYQDISVPLKFGSYEKEHKIIDFQYIKSQRDSIKSLIRAFLWILIIFFNLDQIHRLIRNQSLLNTYVRKIDKGA